MSEQVIGKQIVVYGAGVCQASVCAPVGSSRDKIEAAANAQHPTGLDHGWQVSTSETFNGGQPNPCPCNVNADCQHWLLEC